MRPRVKSIAETSAYMTEGKSLVVLQVNCRIVYNKAAELWNLVDTYNPDVVTGTESWLKENIQKLKFSGLILQLSEGIGLPVVVVFLSVFKDIIASTELRVDDDFEIIAVEVKGMDPKYTREIIGIYRAPNENMLAIERLAARTLPTRNLTKRSIIGGDFNLPQADWKGDAEKAKGFQACVNNLVWDNGYTQVVSGPTRGDSVLDIYLLRPECSLISCNILPRISDHNGVLLEGEWDEICWEPKAERQVPMYHKTDVLALQAFPRENFTCGLEMAAAWRTYGKVIRI